MLLGDSEWSQWSDHELARHCKVNRQTVTNIKNSLAKFASDKKVPSLNLTESCTSEESATKPNVRTYTNKYGKKATMNVSNIGKKKTLSSDNDSPWPDWTNHYHDPDHDRLRPSIEKISIMPPQDAAVLIVNAIYGNPNDARIPYIPGVTDNWDFREAFWTLMIDRARGQLGLDLDDQ